MKKLVLICVLFVAITLCKAQDPVQWQFSANKVSADTYEIHMTATIAEPWNIYSQNTPDGGPRPTSISFYKNPLVLPAGGVKEVGQMKKKYEDVFEVDVLYYSKKVDFVQTVHVRNSSKKPVKTKYTGSVEYMACNSTQCLPPKQIPFTIELK